MRLPFTSTLPRSLKRPSFHHSYVKASLADALPRVADLPVSGLHKLLPWEWKRVKAAEIAVAA